MQQEINMAESSISDVAARIAPYIHHTQVMQSQSIDDLFGCQLYFKCENFQRTGSFKIRGATNAILSLSTSEKIAGVITHSSGNFAQALAKAAAIQDIPAQIVMPNNAPEVKINAVRDFGADITFCEPTISAREATTEQLKAISGATFVHPSNQVSVIQGQGTAAFELLHEHPDMNAVFAPVGGGGLIAGTALAAQEINPNIRIYGGEPLEADDAWRSMASGKIEKNITTDTIADGLRTQLGQHNFPIIQSSVNEIIRVTEAEIISAMQLIWERLKIIIEPSSAVAVAALWKQKRQFNNQKIGIILSGGNVDLGKLPFT
jgi:threonine dehydratase